MKITLKERKIQRPCLGLGDMPILLLEGQNVPFLVVGVNKGEGVSMINLNTLQEGIRFRKPSLGHLSDYIELECKHGECEIINIVRNQNVEIKEI